MVSKMVELEGEKCENMNYFEKMLSTAGDTLYYYQKYDGKVGDYLDIVGCYIEYYDRRAKRCKFEYYSLSIAKYIALALIPVLEVVKFSATPALVTSLTSFSLLIESVLELWKTKEKWSNYRLVNSMLMSAQRRFISDGKPENEEAFRSFVDEIETMITDEARKWVETIKSKKKEKDAEEN